MMGRSCFGAATRTPSLPLDDQRLLLGFGDFIGTVLCKENRARGSFTLGRVVTRGEGGGPLSGLSHFCFGGGGDGPLHGPTWQPVSFPDFVRCV